MEYEMKKEEKKNKNTAYKHFQHYNYQSFLTRKMFAFITTQSFPSKKDLTFNFLKLNTILC